jgi:peptidoglycan/LPS O-acetylase OafA/YrhL
VNKKHLNHIESLRAFAALAVAIFHFTNFFHPSGFLVQSEAQRAIFVYGAQGVEMFYMVSGFIISYSLYKSRYQIQDYFRYMGKRLSRILPPYYVTIGVIICVGFLQATFLWGSPFDLQIRNIIANSLFAVDFIAAFDSLAVHFPDNHWINAIFETLKVEFQFYILIGLLFPFINQRRWLLVLLSVILLYGGIQTASANTVLVHSPYFLLGISAFYVFEEGWSKEIAIIVVLAFASLLNYYVLQDLIVALLTFAFMLFVPSSFRFLNFTGKISYSYYLIHGITGGQFLFFTYESQFAQDYPYLMVIFALLISWVSAFLMYYFIEKPSMLISKRIKYRYKKENNG